MKTGDHTIWGPAQSVKTVAEGVYWIDTASHGGFKLECRANAAMPAALRLAGGWYEEDCAWALVALARPDLFKPEDVKTATETVKNWYPDRYEEFTGTTLTAAESLKKREQEFARLHADDYVVVAAWGAWHEKVPAGMVGTVATPGGLRTHGARQQERWFMVPADEYEKRDSNGFVIDLARHQTIEPLQ